MTTERCEAVAYHYSATYRAIAEEVFERAGLSPFVFEEPEEAKSHLSLATRALVVPYEQYAFDENGDGLEIKRPDLELLQLSEVYDTPWALICGPTTDLPIGWVNRAPARSVVLLTGESPAISAAERIATADTPDSETQRRVAHTLSSWLKALA